MPGETRFRLRRALLLIAVGFPLLLSSCARRQADASPPTPTPVIPASTTNPPLSVPQTQVALLPPQPVPAAAIPARPITEPAIVGPELPPAAPDPPSPSSAATPTVVETPARTPPVPQLGRLLTADQRREYNRVISENVLAAQASLDLLQKRPLAEAQRSAVERVQSFLMQVDEARGSDLELARNLSDRARLLAEDMVRNMPR
jgi:hypothetical protein